MDAQAALLRRLLWNVVPAVAVIVSTWVALVGEEGLLRRHEVKQRLLVTEAHATELEAGNALLRRRIRALREDPRLIRREAATRLLLAEPGSTIYRLPPSE
jgi:cell division protein FtsB